MQVGLMLAVGGRTTLWRSVDLPLFTIGKNPECDLSVPDASVAAVQCTLRRDGNLIVLVNQDDDGTRVNDERIVAEIRLAEGDTIQLGPVVATVRYRGHTGAGEGTRTLHQSSKATAVFNLKAGERTYEIGKRGLTIGSDASNDVVITDPYVSTFHARIATEDGRCMVHDVGSRNGVFIGDQKIQAAEVKPPGVVRIGRVQVEILPTDSGASDDESPPTVDYVGPSPGAQRVRTLATRMAANDAPVLVLGETGTGKEVVSRYIAGTGKRAGKPFVALNCGALSRTLIESELFGHEKGSFTGAANRKAGAFEQADGGTLFLDEIGELPLDLQPQLLRVLETGEIRRVGGAEDIKVNVRVIAATNRQLDDEVVAGRFREDLFHRLHVLSLELPPLRERPEDVADLVRHFLAQLLPHGETVRFEPAALEVLTDHPWPGNVRELRNVIQRAVLMRTNDTLGVSDIIFPPSTSRNRVMVRSKSSGGTSKKTLAEAERVMIVAAIVQHDGNKTDAAEQLGISRSTIHRKLEDLKIDIDEELRLAGKK